MQDTLRVDSFLLVFEILISVGDSEIKINPPFDTKVEITIIEILRHFFAKNDKSVIYLCDSSDNRQHARKRKFDSRHNKFKTNEIEKYDSDFKFRGSEFFTSLLIHKKKPLKKIIVDLFLCQKNQVEK